MVVAVPVIVVVLVALVLVAMGLRIVQEYERGVVFRHGDAHVPSSAPRPSKLIDVP